MAQIDSMGPMIEDRLVSLTEKCGHSIGVEDICRECLKVEASEKCDNSIGDDVITREIVVPHGCRR